MAPKQQKNQNMKEALQAQNSSPKSELSPWKTPTGIAALIGSVAALITALVAAVQLLQSPAQKGIKSEPNCDQYFVGNVVETQIGVPDEVTITDLGLIIVKIRQNSELIGSIKIITNNTDGPVFFLGDANCVQILGATRFQFNKWNKVTITDHKIEFKYDDATNTFSIR
ncbi:MAG TPA: hypothetical protein VJM08_06565 [Anaerolineales bacterium]|nr:hypothetical protein [Anaerolineales bacterium]